MAWLYSPTEQANFLSQDYPLYGGNEFVEHLSLTNHFKKLILVLLQMRVKLRYQDKRLYLAAATYTGLIHFP
jgi:hypothetical protein